MPTGSVTQLDSVSEPRAAPVLLVDDSPVARLVVEGEIVDAGLNVLSAGSAEQALEVLDAPNPPRLVVLDWELPGMSIDLCRRVRAREAEDQSYTYLLVLTSREETEDLVEAMDAGADDFLSKPFDSRELRARLRAGKRIVDLHRRLQGMQDVYRLQSRTDPLTGCLNRRAILERLEAERERARRGSSMLSIAMLDLDHFKSVNDRFGHVVGDGVLREFARRLRLGMRLADTYGRVGGEEFVALWPGTDLAGALTAAERIRSLVWEAAFSTGSALLRVSVSIGVTVSFGEEDDDAVLARADVALYAAKRGGRNRVEAMPAPERLPADIADNRIDKIA
jgi:two-component system cell cycle response regulator